MAGDACIGNEELIFHCSRKRSSLVEYNEPSSFTLLRESIIHSVESRHTKICVPEKYKRQKSKGRLYQEFSPTASSKVDVRFLDQKNNSSPDYLVRAFSVPSERNDKPEDQNLLYKSSNSNQCSAQEKVGSVKTYENFHEEISTPQHKFERELSDEENKFKEEELNISNSKLEKCQVVGENGLRLARRNSAENIFESCSTYSISYANVALSKQNSSTSEKENINSNRIPSSEGKTSIYHERDNTKHSCCKKEECMPIEGENFDDQISLCDSFFTHVINGDYKPVSEQSINSCLKHNLKLSNGKPAFSEKEGKKEADIPNLKPNDPQHELVNNSKSVNNSQKIKKRIRKKNRKKSLEAPVYECPKCGVTYHIMPTMGNDCIRCLHCDFWTSVDPVFLKQERQAWNTCRIC